MKYLKKYESYYSDTDVINKIERELKKRNYSPVEINKIIDSYYQEALNLKEKGKNINYIIKKILNYLPERGNDGYMSVNINNNNYGAYSDNSFL